MAFEEKYPLDYRSGGDRVKMWGAKYRQEIPRIYDIINSLLKHQAYGDIAVQDEDGAMKVFTYQYEDQGGVVHTERHLAIGVQTGEDFQWVDIGQIAPRFGAPLTKEALTNDDIATQPYEAYKLVKTNEDGILPVDISGSASRLVGKVIAVDNLADGQVMVWRSFDQRWHNENKAAVGEGKALVLMNGETRVVSFSGESDQQADIGKWNNVTLRKQADNIADIRYVPTLENTSSETAKLQKATPEAEGRTVAMRDEDGYLYANTPSTSDNSGRLATTANVVAKIAEHNNDSGAHTAAFARQLADFKTNTMGYRKKSSPYVVNTIAEYEDLPTGWYLNCVTPGVTGSGEITLPAQIVENATVTDGTVVWTICRISNITRTEYENALNQKVDKVTFNDLFRDTAAAHNCFYRGKDLTSYFESGEMSAAIADGSFKDIYPGDYIIKTVTINGTTYADQKFIVMDLDYFQPWSFDNTDTHHIVMMPEGALGTQYMNSTNITTGGYVGSYMHATHIPKVNTGIVAAFGSAHVLSHQEYLTNTVDTTKPSGAGSGYTGCATNWAAVSNLKCCLCSENMVYGSRVWGSAMDTGCASKQLAAFRHNQQLRKTTSFWLRAVSGSTGFAGAYTAGLAYGSYASAAFGVRPYFLLA